MSHVLQLLRWSLFSLLVFRCASTPMERAVERATQTRPEQGLFVWPVKTIDISRGYAIKSSKSHLGLDLRGKAGSPILSSQTGTVVYAGNQFRGFGNMVLIEDSNGWASLYAHLSKILVKTGDNVTQLQQIGTMGRTGRATGVHLHFETRKNKVAFDPMDVLPLIP